MECGRRRPRSHPHLVIMPLIRVLKYPEWDTASKEDRYTFSYTWRLQANPEIYTQMQQMILTGRAHKVFSLVTLNREEGKLTWLPDAFMILLQYRKHQEIVNYISRLPLTCIYDWFEDDNHAPSVRQHALVQLAEFFTWNSPLFFQMVIKHHLFDTETLLHNVDLSKLQILAVLQARGELTEPNLETMFMYNMCMGQFQREPRNDHYPFALHLIQTHDFFVKETFMEQFQDQRGRNYQVVQTICQTYRHRILQAMLRLLNLYLIADVARIVIDYAFLFLHVCTPAGNQFPTHRGRGRL